jgi:RNA polymerase sigma-70 factor, ECF subfamily
VTYQGQTNEQLLRTCAGSGDTAAWEEFVRRFQPLIASVVARVAEKRGLASSGVVDELVQETFLKLCRNDSKALKEFKPEHDLAVFGFIKTVALNVAIDYFRSSPIRNEPLEEWQAAPGTEFSGASKAEMSILLGQVDEALSRSTSAQTRERDRMVFWLYYKQGFTAKAIAAIPAIDLTVKGVETVIFRLTKAIRKELGSIVVSERDLPE